jgi:hypothetical protein
MPISVDSADFEAAFFAGIRRISSQKEGLLHTKEHPAALGVAAVWRLIWTLLGFSFEGDSGEDSSGQVILSPRKTLELGTARGGSIICPLP